MKSLTLSWLWGFALKNIFKCVSNQDAQITWWIPTLYEMQPYELKATKKDGKEKSFF